MELLRLERGEKCLKIIVGPMGMRFLLADVPQGKRIQIRKDILGYPMELTESLSKSVLGWGYGEYPFQGESLCGKVTSPELAAIKPEVGEEKLVTLEIDNTFEAYSFKVDIRESEAELVKQILQQFWFD